MKKLKNNKMLLGIGIAFLLLAALSMSYAWFSATVNTENSNKQVVETGTLELTYTDGPEIIMNNIRPGSTITKEVSVKNTGTLDTSYNLVWQELNNEIINNEMVISISCKRLNANGKEEESCEGLKETPVSGNIILKDISITRDITHVYTVTLTFKETNSNQNYNQGKSFTGTLGVNEYKEVTPVYCTYEGDITQGNEFTKGGYTYKYMQERRYVAYEREETSPTSTLENNNVINENLNPKKLTTVTYYELEWKDITKDGWGVVYSSEDDVENITEAPCTYINNKPIVSMSTIFDHTYASSIDISSFDTSNVVNMESMFYDSQVKTIYGLENLNTSNVTNMNRMFIFSNIRNLDLSNFDTSNVTNMSEMFYRSKAKSINLSSFNTSSVTDMSSMFCESNATSLDVSKFDTRNVTNMSAMFYSTKVTSLDLNSFNTSNVTNMQSMFGGSNVKTLDVSNFNTSKVTDMGGMFSGSNATEIKGLEKFDTSNVTNMITMFSYCSAESLNLSSFDTSKVTNMNWMFAYLNLDNIKGLEKLNTSNVTDMFGMFNGSKNNNGIFYLNNIDTSKVTNMRQMFSSAEFKEIDISNFDTSNVTNMSSMFDSLPNLTTIYVGNKFSTDKLENTDSIFYGSKNLVGSNGTKYNASNVNKTYARIDTASTPGYFTLKNS